MIRVSPQLRGYNEAQLVDLVRRGFAYMDGNTVVPVMAGGSAFPLLNDAEETASGTTVATNNSSGTNSVAYDGVTISGSTTLTFDNAQAAHGTNSFKIATTTTATTVTHMDWVFDAALTRIYGAFYVYPTNTIESSVRLIHFRNGAGTLNCGVFLDSATNHVGIRSSADTNLAATTVAMSLNAWNRVEFDYTFDASAGVGTVWLYAGANANGTTADGSATISAQNFGTQCDRVWFGTCTANFSAVSGRAIYFDNLNFNVTGLPGPGPYSLGPPPTAVIRAGTPTWDTPISGRRHVT